MKARAPHKTQPVFCDGPKLVPEGIGEVELRAEEYTERNGRYVLTLSDYYADEYYVNMGRADNKKMKVFLDRATEEKTYCKLFAQMIVRKDGTQFYKPMVQIQKAQRSFTY